MLHTRESVGGVGGVGKWCNVLFFLTMLANDIPITFLTCNMQRKRVWEHTTPQYHSSFHGVELRSV